MNCQLPATGTTAGTTLVVAAIIVIAGLVALLVTRRHGARAVVPVVLIGAATLGFAPAPPADAASDCPTTTAPVVTASTTPPTAPSTTVAESPSSSSVTSTIATTTPTTSPPTTSPVITFCGTLTPDTGGDEVIVLDVFVTIQGGVGTSTVTQPATGNCDGGTVISSGVVVDSDFFDPVQYCADNVPGSTPTNGAASGTWDPQIPATWWGCTEPPSPPSTSPPSTTSPVITFCGTQTPNGGGGLMLDVFITMQGGEGTASLRDPATGDCSGTEFGTVVVVDSNFFEPVQYCLERAVRVDRDQRSNQRHLGAGASAAHLVWMHSPEPVTPPIGP